MTIQMLATWNGLEEDSVVSTLSGAEENRLVAAGLARVYTVGMDGRNPVLSNAEQLTNQALVSADGNPLQLMVDNAAAILALVGVSFGSTYVVGDYVVAGYVL